MTIAVDRSQVDKGIPHVKVLAAGLACTLLFLYCTYLNGLTGTDLFSFFGGLAALSAIVWGSDAIKQLNTYGLATGVPSAGMIGFGSGIGAMLISTRFGVAAPFAAVAVAAATGFILGYLADSVLSMKIPVMGRALTELAVTGSLTLLGLTVMITGKMTFPDLTTGPGGTFIGGGLVFTAFMLGAIALQHPWNAVLPTGKQDRMFMLAAECAFLTLIMAAIMSFVFVSRPAAVISLVIAIAGWSFTYYRYMILSKRDAAAWLDTKPIPDNREGKR
jgi:tetrahydromethanopterin S-methyltransferase subunit C